MPLYDLKCPNNHAWEHLTTADFSSWNCPTCGLKGETNISRPLFVSNEGDEEQAFNALPREERQMILQNRRDLESKSDEILDGRRGIVMGKRFRHIEQPQCPKELRKYT